MVKIWNLVVQNMEGDFRDVMINSGVSLVLKGVGFALGFGFNVLLGRLLGADGTGIYYLAYSVMTTAALIGRIGIDKAALRFIAGRRSTENNSEIKNISKNAVLIVLIFSTLLTSLIILGAPLISKTFFSEPQLIRPLKLMALAVPFVSLIILFAAMLTGIEKIPEGIFLENIGIPLIGLPLLYFLGKGYGVRGAVFSYLLSSMFILIIGITLWKKLSLNSGKKIKSQVNHGRLLLSTGLPLFVAAFVSLLSTRIEMFALGYWSDSAIVGIFSIATRISLLIRFNMKAANPILRQKFASLYTTNDIKLLDDLATKTTWVMAVLAFISSFPPLIVPGWLLSLFGSEFIVGALPLQILVMGQFVDVATGSTVPLLAMTGFGNSLQKAGIISLVVNIVLDVLLIPSFSIVGAAWANTLSRIVYSALTLLAVRKKLGISMFQLKTI